MKSQSFLAVFQQQIPSTKKISLNTVKLYATADAAFPINISIIQLLEMLML